MSVQLGFAIIFGTVALASAFLCGRFWMSGDGDGLCLSGLLSVIATMGAIAVLVFGVKSHKDAAWERVQAAQAEYLEVTK